MGTICLSLTPDPFAPAGHGHVASLKQHHLRQAAALCSLFPLDHSRTDVGDVRGTGWLGRGGRGVLRRFTQGQESDFGNLTALVPLLFLLKGSW